MLCQWFSGYERRETCSAKASGFMELDELFAIYVSEDSTKYESEVFNGSFYDSGFAYVIR
jgi:hypothetical protein